jgi:hypothetical protein
MAYRFRGAAQSGRTDKRRVRCSYCNRHIALWAQSNVMYQHKDERGQPCRAAGTNAYFKISPSEE